MRINYLIILFLSISCASRLVESDQKTENNTFEIADFAIEFSSIGTGVATSELYFERTSQFMALENIEFLKIEKASPLGKEGEYVLLFYINDWTEYQIQKMGDIFRRTDKEMQELYPDKPVRSQQNFKKEKLFSYPNVKVEVWDWK